MKETIEKLRQEGLELLTLKNQVQEEFNSKYKEHLSELSARITEATIRMQKLNDALKSLTNLCDHDYEYSYKDRETQYTCKICGHTYWEY